MLLFLPLVIIEAYLTVSLLLFLLGPFDWPRIDVFPLSLLLVCYQTALALGYYIGAYRSPGVRASLNVNYWFKAALVSNVVLIVPYSFVYTGRFPWEIIHGIPDQAQAFANYYDLLSTPASADRIFVMAMRTLFAPLLVALVPLFFWTKGLGLRWKILFFVYVAMYFAFAMLRGTDKESADFFVYFFVGLFSRIVAERFGKGIALSRRKAVLILAFVGIFLGVAYSAFVERKMARLGVDDQVCIEQAGVCADLNSGLMPYLDPAHQFGVSMATLYLSIGYYGMGLAIEEDFDSSFGLGHSIFLSNATRKISGVSSFPIDSYTAKVATSGWDPLVYWVTTYVWFANDIGFIGVVPFMLAIGFLFSRVWQDAVLLRDLGSVILLPQIVLMLFYLPAFNVIMQNVDSYFAFVFWLAFWAIGRLTYAELTLRADRG